MKRKAIHEYRRFIGDGLNQGHLRELTGGGLKRRQVTDARAAIALRVREELGLTAAEMARDLGVNTSAITRALERVEGNGTHK